MQSFYVPWVGPDKFRVWVLITILTVALFTCLLWIPVATCSANDDSGVCAPAVYPPELPGLYTVGTPMWRTCQCNASVVVRTSANARTLSNTVFANGDLPPTPEARGLNALTVSVLQFVLNVMLVDLLLVSALLIVIPVLLVLIMMHQDPIIAVCVLQVHIR